MNQSDMIIEGEHREDGLKFPSKEIQEMYARQSPGIKRAIQHAAKGVLLDVFGLDGHVTPQFIREVQRMEVGL